MDLHEGENEKLDLFTHLMHVLFMPCGINQPYLYNLETIQSLALKMVSDRTVAMASHSYF